VALIESPSRDGAPFKELDGFTLDACNPLTGDHLSARVMWNGKTDISTMKGKGIGLYIKLHKARIFP
jgi:hypothetical protein